MHIVHHNKAMNVAPNNWQWIGENLAVLQVAFPSNKKKGTVQPVLHEPVKGEVRIMILLLTLTLG